MKAKEVHTLSKEEMVTESGRLRHRLFELKSQAVTEKLENPRQMGDLRRDIARLNTELRSRELKETKA